MNTRNEYLDFKFDCPKLGDVKNRPTESDRADSFAEAVASGVLLLVCILLVWAIGAAYV